MSDFVSLWWEGILRASLQGGLALGLAWLICWMFPKMPSKAKVWVWRIALVKLVLGLFPIPALRIEVLEPATQAPTVATLAMLDPGGPTAHSSATWLPSWEHALAFLWLAVVAVSAIRVIRALHLARNLCRESIRVTDTNVLDTARALAQSLNLSRAPKLMCHESIEVPTLLFVGEPVVVLPGAALAECRRGELPLILAHEFAHLRNADLRWGWLSVLSNVLFFFHPLAWLGVRQVRVEQEVSADLLALEVTRSDPAAYGRMLLGFVKRSRPSPLRPIESFAVSGTAGAVKARLRALKDHDRKLRVISVLSFALALSAAATAALPVWNLVPKPLPVSPAGSSVGAPSSARSIDDLLGFTPAQARAASRIIDGQNRGFDAIPAGLPEAELVRRRRQVIYHTNVRMRAMLEPWQQKLFDRHIGPLERLKP